MTPVQPKPYVQTRRIEGTVTATGAAPLRAISIPLLPTDGSWSITGHLIAVNTATPRQSMTFYPQFTGVCEGGVVTNNSPTNGTTNTTPTTTATSFVPTNPATKSKSPWAPGGPALAVTGQQVEVELTGIDATTIVWAWSFEVVVVALPAQAPNAAA